MEEKTTSCNQSGERKAQSRKLTPLNIDLNDDLMPPLKGVLSSGSVSSSDSLWDGSAPRRDIETRLQRRKKFENGIYWKLYRKGRLWRNYLFGLILVFISLVCVVTELWADDCAKPPATQRGAIFSRIRRLQPRQPVPNKLNSTTRTGVDISEFLNRGCLSEELPKRPGLKRFVPWLRSKKYRTLSSDIAAEERKSFPLSSFSSNSRAKLVVAGQITVGDQYCNIGQMQLGTGEWLLTDRVQLSLYNSYSGGEVYAMLANHTFSAYKSIENGKGGEELIIVGAFDTTYRNNQVAYCSVGKWDGSQLIKVGEGLCNSALSKGMKITAAALAGQQDVFVAGSFHTQVWNGDMHEFVKIFNIAHYNAIERVWLPLPIGQISCSWCTVTVLALAWDEARNWLHIAGKFNAIDGLNIPAGLAIYDLNTNRLVAHPAGGLSMINVTEDGVGTALQLDAENGVLYVMGSFERLTTTGDICFGIAAWEISENRWTCLSDSEHTVLPIGLGNMLLTRYGLMISGLTTNSTTWEDTSRPYTIALLTTRVKPKPTWKPKPFSSSSSSSKTSSTSSGSSSSSKISYDNYADDDFDDDPGFLWSWLPGFPGHDKPLHVLTAGYDDYDGAVFIGGDHLIAMWAYVEKPGVNGKVKNSDTIVLGSASSVADNTHIPVTFNLDQGLVRGSVTAMSQLIPPLKTEPMIDELGQNWQLTILIASIALSSLIGMLFAVMFNKSVNQAVLSFLSKDEKMKGISLDTLTYSAVENANVAEAYQRAMETRFVQEPKLISLINPQEIILHRIVGKGSFGRVWSAKWRNSSVAVKEFVFAQAAVAGRSSMQRQIIEEIIGEAGMMAILRHPHVLQLYGCSLTSQAIWIVSELCSLGSLRQILDDTERDLSLELKLQIALNVAEGMSYLHGHNPPIIHRDLKSHNILIHETTTSLKEKSGRDENNKERKKRGNNNENSKLLKCDGQYKTFANSEENEKESKEGTKKILNENAIIAKIGDWGSARAALSGSRTMTHGIGTPCWLAPEVIKHARSSRYSDVYSFAIVLWELATREEVYSELETPQIIARVANDNLRPPVPEDCPWAEIMVKCWDEMPQNRMSFDKICEELTRILAWVKNRNRSNQTQGSDSYSDSCHNNF